jgi:type I restriction enzyme R subunit
VPSPGEHKTVQARILRYASDIGWDVVTQADSERLRGFDPSIPSPADRAYRASLFLREVFAKKMSEFNPGYDDTPDALLGIFRNLPATEEGNFEFLQYVRNMKTHYVPNEGRELDLKLVDFDKPSRNEYHVTEEFSFHNGRFGTREDVVFLVNGIPVLTFECKNATKREAIALGVDQIRRYHEETPELFVPETLFAVTEALGFVYGVTWNTQRRNIFQWKDDAAGQLETKVKSFCDRSHVLDLLRSFVVFAEKDERLEKYVLRQHQRVAVELVVGRCLDRHKTRGLVWHTQGSGKTYTMIKAAELLFKAARAEKPTIIFLIDRNELEDQMLRNLASLGIANVEHADRMTRLNELLRNDYRGLVVSTIHKFRDMPAAINERSNIYVLIDEAHRTTGGDLGVYLTAAVPNATFVGFTGTPIDRTAHGRGTFKTFGVDDDRGYLHKYSIAESIEDGATLPLYYSLAASELLVPAQLMEDEFLEVADVEGVADIEELNAVLDRAVNLKNFLKADKRVTKVASEIADHYRSVVEPLGYKAFVVGVDREACAKYKRALDGVLPPEYSEVVFTGNNNDPVELKALHLDETREREIRRAFQDAQALPKILIVTEKLLTGFDAPILYTMYLDKPMRDHTLLQAVARVNRPYENEDEELVKPHGLIVDFVGIFDKLERALAFDSDEVDAVVKDVDKLKELFATELGVAQRDYLPLITQNFNDKDVDTVIEHFRDDDRRSEIHRLYKQIEALFEILAPDAFLRPFLDDYATISAIFAVVRRAYSDRLVLDRDFLRKTNEVVQAHVDVAVIKIVDDYVALGPDALAELKAKNTGDGTRVVNLVKSITRAAEEEPGDPFLVALSDRVRAVQERFRTRQAATEEALDELTKLIQENEDRKARQADAGMDAIAFFVKENMTQLDPQVTEKVGVEISATLKAHPRWSISAAEERTVRQAISFVLLRHIDDIDAVAQAVNDLLSIFGRSVEP